jgi:hypothetical protein
VDLQWDNENQALAYSLNVFNPFNDFDLNIWLEGTANIPIIQKSFIPNTLGDSESFTLSDPSLAIPEGNYTANFQLAKQNDGSVILSATKEINVGGETSIFNALSQLDNSMRIKQTAPLRVNVSFVQSDQYKAKVYNISGQLVTQVNSSSNTFDIQLPIAGVYIFNVSSSKEVINRKMLVR